MTRIYELIDGQLKKASLLSHMVLPACLITAIYNYNINRTHNPVQFQLAEVGVGEANRCNNFSSCNRCKVRNHCQGFVASNCRLYGY